jgi:hypothetical protein
MMHNALKAQILIPISGIATMGSAVGSRVYRLAFGLQNLLRPISVGCVSFRRYQEEFRCRAMLPSMPARASATSSVKGLATKRMAVSWAVPVWTAIMMPLTAYAQGPARPGLSAVKAPPPDNVKPIADAISTVIAYPVYALLTFWNYLIDHTAAATLLTAGIAGYIALRSIHVNRSIARLRETFTAYSKDNWDADIIKSKFIFTNIKRDCVKNPQNIAVYFDPLPECDLSSITDPHEKEKKLEEHKKISDAHDSAIVTLRTIMNDYENKALGIREGILDETYAYRYARGGVIGDWQHLSPLVATYRAKHKNNLLFIEFEGLVNAWSQNKSFSTSKKIKPSEKRMIFK